MLQLLFFLLVLFTVNSFADDRQTIIWLSDSENYVKNFRQANADNIDSDTNNLLLTQINNYKIELEYTPLARIEKLMKSGENYCIANRLKTKERLKNNLFSLPLNLYLGLRVYSKKKLAQKYLNINGELTSITDLLTERENKWLLVSKGRSYSDLLDQQITQVDKRFIYVLSKQSYAEAAFDMLAKERVDYIIEYPAEVALMSKKRSKPLPLYSVSVTDSEKYVIGYLACNKSAIGKQFIDNINQVLTGVYQQKGFYLAHVNHLNKSDLIIFNYYFNQVFSTNY
ncbi:transporter substrate-binding domain-containing protein [Colwellia sp. RSH04]|uniref:transporter substrate-binding domain-containing protein n=1 Tax=Colwellia sp. RSH04 TaxID=2305464 RepID=UPI000E586E6D|nr:transporter substrate-binding domain-containing protein [Colwellia sp. RSH04]RHW77182.1 hypothetical protein D1094_04630 [Colwellia sp. RSH04]